MKPCLLENTRLFVGRQVHLLKQGKLLQSVRVYYKGGDQPDLDSYTLEKIDLMEKEGKGARKEGKDEEISTSGTKEEIVRNAMKVKQYEEQ